MDCLICSAKTDAYACRACTNQAAIHLLDMSDLLNPAKLDQKRAGIHGISYNRIGGKSSGDKPLPYNPKVGDVESIAYGTIFSIWNELVDDEPSLRSEIPSGASASTVAAWLARQAMDHLRYMEQADEMYDDIAEKHRAVMRLWDVPPVETFIGRCGNRGEVGVCSEPVYAVRGKLTARCRRCGAEHDVAARYLEMEAQSVDHLATLKEISVLLAPAHGERVRLRRLRYLAEECGRLAASGSRPEWMGDGSIRTVSVYRLGDVTALIAEDEKAERERKAKRKTKVA